MAPGLAVAGVLAFTQAVDAGGVVINMPSPPKKAPATADTATTVQAGSAPIGVLHQPQPDVGDLALSRYAGARTEPYDLYDSGMPYYRNYNYNYGYPWGWGWGWGFPFIGIGFVGCSTHCAPACH
jgi:hypothetical protein